MMGAFFIVHQSEKAEEHKIIKVFSHQSLTKYTKFNIGEYALYVFSKILLTDLKNTNTTQNSLHVIGTIAYKELAYHQGLNAIAQEIASESLDETALRGNYCLLYQSNNSIELLIDSLGIQNVFYNSRKTIISSSFLAMMDFEKSLSINKNAVTEVLCTGSLVGPDTVINSIFRVETNAIPSVTGVNIRFAKRPPLTHHSSKNFEGEVDSQIDYLKKYFIAFKSLADTYGADSGITGGHDSRMIMAMAQKEWNNVSYHSHYRKTKDAELEIAEMVCEAAKVHMSKIPTRHATDLNESEFEELLSSCYHFFDGQARMHSYWTEEYNTQNYREKVLGSRRLGLSGIGGEQYRNMEGMYLTSWRYEQFVRYYIILNVCGRIFKDANSEKKFTKYLKDKISSKLGIAQNTYGMNMLLMKRYLNEVFIPSRLGMRNNAENKLSFFISPFIDASVSIPAYQCIPHLGLAYRFQEHMITKLNSKIASVTSVYGFDFSSGTPLKVKFKQFLQNIIPHHILQLRIDSHAKNNDDSLYQKLVTVHPVCLKYTENVKQLGLPIDIDLLIKRVDLMPLVIGMGYFLEKNNLK